MMALVKPAEVLPAESQRAVYVKERLAAINKQHNELILENGLLLREYKANGYFKEDGYESFDEAIESLHEKGVLDYGARNARHFIAIVDMVDRLELTSAEIKAIGVSKLREIAALKSETEQRRLLSEATNKTVGEIQKEAKRLRDKAAGRDTDPLNPTTHMFTDTQKGFFKECIRRARTEYAIEDNVPEAAVLVDYILADWHSGLPNENNDNAGCATENPATETAGETSSTP